jgi:transcriptional regulator with XRE-family HTH domain
MRVTDVHTERDGWPAELFGSLVGRARLRLGVSQTELSRRCGLSRNCISLIERDVVHDLALSTFLALHERLNLPLSEMVECWQNTLEYLAFQDGGMSDETNIDDAMIPEYHYPESDLERYCAP